MSYTDFLDMMADTITVYAMLPTLDSSGKPQYDLAHPQVFPCRIQMGNHIVVDANGREVTARGTIYVGTFVAPPLTSKIVLPSDYTVQSPPILDSSSVRDENGPHHVKLEIG